MKISLFSHYPQFFLTKFSEEVRTSSIMQQKKVMGIVLVVFAAIAIIYYTCWNVEKPKAVNLNPVPPQNPANDLKDLLITNKRRLLEEIRDATLKIESIQSAKFYVDILDSRADKPIMEKEFIIKKANLTFDPQFLSDVIDSIHRVITANIKLEAIPYTDIMLKVILKEKDRGFCLAYANGTKLFGHHLNIFPGERTTAFEVSIANYWKLHMKNKPLIQFDAQKEFI